MSKIKHSQLAHYTSYAGLEGILREGFRFYSIVFILLKTPKNQKLKYVKII